MSPRSATRSLVQDFIRMMHAKRVFLDAGSLHAIRDFAADCYETGRKDVLQSSTIRAPAPDDGTYLIMGDINECETPK